MTVERSESLILGAILLTVAGFAGAASFSHVHDWTMRNSPAGTPGWFGWANATISELVPTACALVIRRRRRTGQPVGYPLGLLIAAVALSLAAQLAVAKPGPSGWLLSAVPALAFVALTKLVLSTASHPVEVDIDRAEALDLTEETTPPMAPERPAARVNGAIPSGVVR
jgi:peptidoglycan/LPS O-acetylase OafA/YrhL